MISNHFKGDIMTTIIVINFQFSTVFSVSVLRATRTVSGPRIWSAAARGRFGKQRRVAVQESAVVPAQCK